MTFWNLDGSKIAFLSSRRLFNQLLWVKSESSVASVEIRTVSNFLSGFYLVTRMEPTFGHGRTPAGLFAVGFIWISFHAGCMVLVARLINAPLFFIAVGSQARPSRACARPRLPRPRDLLCACVIPAAGSSRPKPVISCRRGQSRYWVLKCILASSRNVWGVCTGFEGLHMITSGGKGHISLFPLHVLHGFVHPGKLPRHFDWTQECTSVIPKNSTSSVIPHFC